MLLSGPVCYRFQQGRPLPQGLAALCRPGVFSPGLSGRHGSGQGTTCSALQKHKLDILKGPLCSKLENHSVLGFGVGHIYSAKGLYSIFVIYLRMFS